MCVKIFRGFLLFLSLLKQSLFSQFFNHKQPSLFLFKCVLFYLLLPNVSCTLESTDCIIVLCTKEVMRNAIVSQFSHYYGHVQLSMYVESFSGHPNL